MKETTKERLIQIIAEQLGKGIEEVTPQSSFKDLAADSLDILDIILKIEEEFNVDISDEKAEKINTVQELFDYLVSKGIN